MIGGEKVVSRALMGIGLFVFSTPSAGCYSFPRVRYGVKPLYYVKTDDCFAFASEIKALLSLPFVAPVLNRVMAFHYLGLSCIFAYRRDAL